MSQHILKRCRCSPSCYKWLRRKAREQHYHNANQADMQDSDFGSDADMDSDDGEGADGKSGIVPAL